VKGLGVGIDSLQTPGVAAVKASPSFGPLMGSSPKSSPALNPAKGDLNAVLGAPALGGTATATKAKTKAGGSPPKAADGKAKDSKDTKAGGEESGVVVNLLASGSVATGDADSDDDKKVKPDEELKGVCVCVCVCYVCRAAWVWGRRCCDNGCVGGDV
jgi:hypothetical protein